MGNLTLEQVIACHKMVINTDGGDDRLLSEANLHQMVFLANRIDDGYRRAALVFFSLIAYPAFCQGNSHTAQLVAEMILNHNGYTLGNDTIEMTGLVQGIALFTVEQGDVEEWLRSHALKQPGPME
jgi:death-on-curing family protein